jgi:voltage-gated potassium channel Kch
VWVLGTLALGRLVLIGGFGGVGRGLVLRLMVAPVFTFGFVVDRVLAAFARLAGFGAVFFGACFRVRVFRVGFLATVRRAGRVVFAVLLWRREAPLFRAFALAIRSSLSRLTLTVRL